MTDDIEGLIAEARWVADEHEGAEWEPDAIAMIHRLADALEQVRRSADEWWKQYDAMRERAEKAEATLAKVRELAENADLDIYERERLVLADDLFAVLDESPTERETFADRLARESVEAMEAQKREDAERDTPADREDVARVLRDADRPDVPAHLPPPRKYADMATALMERFTITDGGGSR